MKTRDDIIQYFQLILEMEHKCRQNLIQELLQLESSTQLESSIQSFIPLSPDTEEKIGVLLAIYQQINIFLKENQSRILMENGAELFESFHVCMDLIAFFTNLHEFQFQIFELEIILYAEKFVPFIASYFMETFGVNVLKELEFHEEQTKRKIKVQEQIVSTMIQELENTKGE